MNQLQEHPIQLTLKKLYEQEVPTVRIIGEENKFVDLPLIIDSSMYVSTLSLPVGNAVVSWDTRHKIEGRYALSTVGKRKSTRIESPFSVVVDYAIEDTRSTGIFAVTLREHPALIIGLDIFNQLK